MSAQLDVLLQEQQKLRESLAVKVRQCCGGTASGLLHHVTLNPVLQQGVQRCPAWPRSSPVVCACDVMDPPAEAYCNSVCLCYTWNTLALHTEQLW
jgi:hypothetical protein